MDVSPPVVGLFKDVWGNRGPFLEELRMLCTWLSCDEHLTSEPLRIPWGLVIIRILVCVVWPYQLKVCKGKSPKVHIYYSMHYIYNILLIISHQRVCSCLSGSTRSLEITHVNTKVHTHTYMNVHTVVTYCVLIVIII